MKPKKTKLVDYLVAHGHFSAPVDAERHIRAGLVRVDGQVADKPGFMVPPEGQVTVDPGRGFVGRGALKLEAAIKEFSLSPSGLDCADVGCCTGGFTEVLLLNGAKRVYAIDVGYGDLAWSIRQDPRVVVMERTNARHIEKLPDPISFVTMDLSFISVTKVLPAVVGWLAPRATLVVLVKPQFEAAKDEVGEGGIVRDEHVHARVVERVMEFLPTIGLHYRASVPSPILGTEGNKEFLMWAERA